MREFSVSNAHACSQLPSDRSLTHSTHSRFRSFRQTLFGPTNEAFTALFDAAPFATKFGTDPYTLPLTNILLYHIVGARVPASAVMAGPVNMLNGGTVTIATDDGVQLTGAFSPLGPSTVETVDVIADDGNILHVVDSVLVPSWVGTTIVDVASADPDTFSTLVELVVAAGLSDVLGSETESFTVFAPTNSAFEALLTDLNITLEEAKVLPNLEGILKYHILSKVAASSTLTDGMMVPTKLGPEVEISVSVAGVMVNDANVAEVDVLANNGIIHAIDKVLLPPEDPPTPAPSAATSTTAFASLMAVISGLFAMCM